MARKAYLNFVIRIGREGEGYRATVIESPAGEAFEDFALPAVQPAIAAFLEMLGRAAESRAPLGRALRLSVEPATGATAGERPAGGRPEDVAKVFGARLFDALIVGGVRELLRTSQARAEAQAMGLRVRLRFDDVAELAGLPWEYLYDTEAQRYLDLTADTALVRYLELKQGIEPLEVDPPLRVLVVIADTPPALDVEAEWQKLKTALQNVVKSRKVAVERLEPATLGELRERLRSRDYHVLHFIGHGDFDDAPGGGGALMFEGEDGGSARVSGEKLAVTLADHDSLRLAVLNACEGARGGLDGPHAGVAQHLLGQGVPAALAMQFPISDKAAIEFASTFYDAIAKDYSIEAAVGEARKAIYGQDHGLEWGTPVLFSRSPDGHLWKTKPTRPSKLKYVVAGAGVLAVAGGLILSAVRPRVMDGDFNIAVADFSTLGVDPAGSAAQDAERLSLRVYYILREEVAELDLELGTRIWHDSMGFMEKGTTIGKVGGDTPAEREVAAKALAERIGANIVVYGVLTPEGVGRASFSPEFYVRELRDQADELVGPHALGESIPLVLPLSTTSNAVRANRLVAPRANMLTRFTAGLVYEMSGDPERALATFEGAAAELDASGSGDGREVLYLFIGREYQHLARMASESSESDRFLDQARASFQKALDANPSYGRAQIGLGNYFYERAQRMAPAERIGSGDLEAALDHFLIAASPISGSELLQIKARMGIGNTFRLWLEADLATDDPEGAAMHFEQAVDQFEETLTLAVDKYPEQTGQTQLNLGATHEAWSRGLGRAGDAQGARFELDLARNAYARCIEMADANPVAWFLQELRDGSCQPFLQRVCEDLVELGEPCG